MEYISFARLIEAVYLPQIIYTVIALTLSYMSSHRSSTSTELLTAATVGECGQTGLCIVECVAKAEL